ncbi:glycosyltransferase family 2 protein [Palleronia caenipelagi]|uniref:Glycosyltransferase family 2 protein n=1 Tax=Palleronia caenipelagi TaxID=2489174 RepID=A0A547QAT3_9RHOB|nr:glycosyltransferase family 2 protein [Palleronia caenipelagi]TRD23503.1 glycosyltransferase family 2 protein [Palleronia caenipelagi]
MRLTIITAVRDEAHNLVDWIAHHRALGATDFLIFTNDCADGTEALLDALAPAGVTHIHNEIPEGRTPQWSALKQARAHPLLKDADWVAVLDCDEYVNLRSPLNSFAGLIAACDADAIVLPWRLFGHSGHARRSDLSPLRAYTKAIPEDALYPALARFFKTLYRPAAFREPGVHRPKARKGDSPRWSNGSGQPLPPDFRAQQQRIMLWGAPMATDLVQLNHYSLRSAEDFIIKRSRGLPNHTDKEVGLTYWVERNFNSVEDKTILRHADATEAEATRLRALPQVADIEAIARTHHARRFETLLKNPDLARLYGRLILAENSVPPPESLARELVRIYAAAQTKGES